MNRIFATLILLILGAPASAAPLHLQIAQARQTSPQAFAHLEQLRAAVIAHPPPYERRGGIARAMKQLGRDGLLPLLALIGDAHAFDGAPVRTREMLLVGAIEAVGELRDLRAAPVMRQILDGAESNAEVARAAAEALGTLETDDEVAFLAAHARAGDRFERAAISGLGFARGAASVAALRARLESHPPAETAEALADAIGWLGSSWAWTALGPARHEEGTALRDELSATLVAAFPTYEGAAREAIARALLVIDHPSTPNRLATLRAHASPALASSLQSLERRWLRVTR